MKHLLLFFILSINQIIAQNNLAFLYSSVGFEYGKCSTVDSDNNYIVGALFQNTINANPNGTTNFTAPGASTHNLIAKYNDSGQLVWAKMFGGTTTSEAPHGVACDAAKNIYVTGYFGSTTLTGAQNASFNPNGGGIVATEGHEDCFVAKYDENGNYQWAFGLGNIGQNTQERAWDIAVDASGNSYVVGGFQGTMDFNPLGTANNLSVSTAGTVGLFLAKYDTNGINQWTVILDAQCTSVFNEGYATCDLDNNGNLYLAGNFRGANVNMNPLGTSSTLSSSGNCDIFLAKYSTINGNLSWVKKIGGLAQDLVSPGALRCDNNGNPYFTGRLSGTGSVDFDPSASILNITNSALYITSYDINGNLRYAKGMNSGGGDGGHRIDFDSQNNVYVAGWMNGTATFGTVSRTANSTTADAFIAKYNNDLSTCSWAFNFGGTGSTANSICAGLSVDHDDNPIMTGQLYGTLADVDPSISTKSLSSVGENDCFIVKYTSTGQLWQNSVLAVEFVEPYNAYQVKEGIKIDWTTATEQNSNRFIIERSTNAIDFEEIGTIRAQGNSTKTHRYSYIDIQPNHGVNYYRVVELDNDGSLNYSSLLAVNFEDVMIHVYPNPTQNYLYVESDNLLSNKIILKNSFGRIVLISSDVTNKIDMSNLANGIYFLTIKDSSKVIKIIKQ